MDKPGPKGVMSCLGNVTATREVEQIGTRGGVKFLPIWTLGNVNQRISLMVVVVWVIALQYCVPCMPCLACSNLLHREKKLGYYPKCCGFSW